MKTVQTPGLTFKSNLVVKISNSQRYQTKAISISTSIFM